MPYINPDRRAQLDPIVEDLVANLNAEPGALNYVITKLIIGYAPDKDYAQYSTVAEITGVLENVKQEFYRRYATPYEDAKIAINGDVYE